MKIKYKMNSLGKYTTQCQHFLGNPVGSDRCSQCAYFGGSDDVTVNCTCSKPTNLEILKGIVGANKKECEVLNQLVKFSENTLGILPGDLVEDISKNIHKFIHYKKGDRYPWKTDSGIFKAVKIYNKPAFSKGQVLMFWDDESEGTATLGIFSYIHEGFYISESNTRWDNARALTEKEYKGESDAK